MRRVSPFRSVFFSTLIFAVVLSPTYRRRSSTSYVSAYYQQQVPSSTYKSQQRHSTINTFISLHDKHVALFTPTSSRIIRKDDQIRLAHASKVIAHASLSSISDSSSTIDGEGDNTNRYNNPKNGHKSTSSDEEDTKNADASTTATATAATSMRLRRLKDLMWAREAREDLTAAEFACSVDVEDTSSSSSSSFRSSASSKSASTKEDTTANDSIATRKRKRAVDYEKLLSQLNRRIRDMGCTDSPLGRDTDQTSFSCALQPGVGMGSMVYTNEQREALLERIIRTRQLLLDVMKGHELYKEEDMPFQIAIPEIRVELPKATTTESSSSGDGNDSSVNPIGPGPKLYVRDDGTVDWDGALQDREALRKFGTAVWARINGRDPESISDDESEDSNNKNGVVGGGTASAMDHAKPKVVTAKIEDTPEIQEARSKLNNLVTELSSMERRHVRLLNSAISAGQAVANVNLASLEPEQRSRIRESAEELEIIKEQVTFYTLIYELERIYSYLLRELGNPALTGYIPLQDRLNVAEFGLLESQIESFRRQVEVGEMVDTDVLAVVMEQLTDFKRRLGIDYLVTGFTWDGESIRRWVMELGDKTKKGLAFYAKGVRLFWNDIVFCATLINRAAQGYTLKPREVRTLRRTLKDIITFIPVVIILLIPLSPVGHVLVFGAIQKFFPDFFPSCFTEQRQNLLQLYENAEYTEFSIDENWKQKLARVSEALVYILATTSRAVYAKVKALIQGDGPSTPGSDDSEGS